MGVMPPLRRAQARQRIRKKLCELRKRRRRVWRWSGLRGSNPSNWLGKPGHYHYAKPAFRSAPRVSAPSTTARDALILSEHLRTATPPSRLEIVRPSVEID